MKISDGWYVLDAKYIELPYIDLVSHLLIMKEESGCQK